MVCTKRQKTKKALYKLKAAYIALDPFSQMYLVQTVAK